jgi:poly [ADP-ribose] polymerase
VPESVPTREPDVFRRFQYTDFGENSNKKWDIEAWNMGGYWLQRTKWSRTGRPKPQQKVKRVSGRHTVEALIARKKQKGYEELDLAKVSTSEAPTTGCPGVDNLVRDVYSEANLYIDSYLSTTVDQLSAAQLSKGRRILRTMATAMGSGNQSISTHASDPYIQGMAENFYKAIPTQLPHKISAFSVTRDLISDMHEQEQRILQLENAVNAQRKTTTDTGKTAAALDLLGAEVMQLDVGSVEFQAISAMIKDTRRHANLYGREPVSIYTVRIPDERSAFDKRWHEAYPGEFFDKIDLGWRPPEAAPASRGGLFFHGTNSANIKYILETGLIIPGHAANGSMFGRGIYFADVSTKSLNYSKYKNTQFLLIAEVALGIPYEAPEAMKISKAPDGYHSVWGKADHTRSYGGRLRYNEFIVYKTWQQTIRYLVIMG